MQNSLKKLQKARENRLSGIVQYGPFRVLSSPVNVSPGHEDGHCSPWRAVSVSVSADVDRSCRLVCLSSSPVNVSPGHEDGHCSPWRAVSVFVSAAVDRAVGMCAFSCPATQGGSFRLA